MIAYICCCSVILSDSLRPHGLQHNRPLCPSPSPRLFQVHIHCITDVIQPSHPLMSSSPSAFNLSPNRDFFNESTIHTRWPKYQSFSFSISPFSEYSGLISFKIDSFDLLSVQRILRSALQHHSLKASILWCSAIFMVQLSQPYVTTGKTIALIIRTLSAEWCLFFNTLSRFVIAFLLRSSRLLISWLQSPSAVILGPTKRKSATTSTFSPSIFHEVMGLDAMT